MSTSIWDDPNIVGSDGAYVKWETPGDCVTGDLISVGQGEDMQGGACPQLVIREDDGLERILTASQAQLKSKLRKHRPNAGDRIKILFERVEKRDGGKTLKHFEVSVVAGGAKGTPAADVNSAEEPF